MHSSRMRTVRNSSRLLSGGSPPPHPPRSRPPLEQANPPPRSRHPPEQTSPCCKACWDTTCNACWDSTPPPVNRITDTCKNITFATSLRTVIIRFHQLRFSKKLRNMLMKRQSSFMGRRQQIVHHIFPCFSMTVIPIILCPVSKLNLIHATNLVCV